MRAPNEILIRGLKIITTAAMATALALTASTVMITASAAAKGSDGNTPAAEPQNDSNSIAVPAGTNVLVRMIDSVDSSKNKAGDRFTANLEADLVSNGKTVAPRGATVYGRLAEAKSAGHLAGKSELQLELTDIMINNQLQPMLTSDYQVASNSRGANTAKKVGGGAAVGAIVGAIVGGGKGAAVGAGVGAGAGTAVQVLTRGQQVRVPSETLLEFRLQQPLVVPQSNGSN